MACFGFLICNQALLNLNENCKRVCILLVVSFRRPRIVDAVKGELDDYSYMLWYIISIAWRIFIFWMLEQHLQCFQLSM